MKSSKAVGLLFSVLIHCPALLGQSFTTSNAERDFVPSGYDVILDGYPDSGKSAPTDMQSISKILVQWANQAPLQTLEFLGKELESNDEKRVKAALFSVASLSVIINHEANRQVDAAVKGDFNTQFPVEKIKKAIAGRPDRAIQFRLRPGTPQVELFPELPGLQQQYWAEKEKVESGAK